LLFGLNKELVFSNYAGLIATGTAEASITMAAKGSEEPGAWEGIVFNSFSETGSIMEHVDVGYGGADAASIVVFKGDPVIRDSTVHHSGCYGILVYEDRATPTIENISYADNVCGDYSSTPP
jgi:hypothetical protein